MDPLPIHGSCLKFLGGVAFAAACCVVVGLVALTFNRHPCLGLNKAGGEGSCVMPEAIDKRSTWMSPHTPMQWLRSGRPSGAGPRPCLPLPGHEENVDAVSDERCEHPRCAADPSGEAEYYGGKGDSNDECIQRVEGLERVHQRAFSAFFFTIDKRSKKTSLPTSWWCLGSVRPSGAGPRPCLPGREETGAGVGTTHGDFASIFLGIIGAGDLSGGATGGGRHHGNPCSIGGCRTSPVLWVPKVLWVPTRGMSVRWQLYGRHATSSSGLRGYHRGLHAEASGIITSSKIFLCPLPGPFILVGMDMVCNAGSSRGHTTKSTTILFTLAWLRVVPHTRCYSPSPRLCSLRFYMPLLYLDNYRRWFDDSASTWVLGSSYFYRRQRHQHLSVVSIFFFNGSTDPLFTDATHGTVSRNALAPAMGELAAA